MVKNYTSEVPAARSVQHIEDKLAVQGARQVLKLYDEEQRLSGIAFIIPVNGNNMPFRLAARIDNVELILRSRLKRPAPGTLERIRAQAERTAWKLISDWVDIQMSLIELQQVKLMEVFLPYLYNHKTDQTYFETIEKRGFDKLLIAEKTQ